MKFKCSSINDDTLLRKKNGKRVENETDFEIVKPDKAPKEIRLAALDIFAGCGGLSYGLEKAGMYLSPIQHVSFQNACTTCIHMHALLYKVYLIQSGQSSMKSQLLKLSDKTILKQQFLLKTVT